MNTPKYPTKLTCKFFLKQKECPTWNSSEHRQLDVFQEQDMFGEPCPPPKKAIMLPLLWTYLVKI